MNSKELPPLPDFRLLFESAPGCFLVLSTDFTILAASDAYLLATMTRREEIVGRGVFDVFPDNPGDPAATGTANLRASLDRALRTHVPDTMGVQKYDIRKPPERGGGFEQRHWSPINSPVLVDGRVAYLIHRVEDVTDFVRLREHEFAREKATQELADRAKRMETEIFRRAHELQAANQRLRELQVDLEARVEERTRDLKRSNENLQREIEERERAEQALDAREEELRQAQRLEAIGRLAGGIAHDFNNMLSVIIGFGECIQPGKTTPEELQQYKAEILLASQRAAAITRQLLAFSRRQVLAPRVIDLNEHIRSISNMLGRLLGQKVRVVEDLSESLGRTRVDPSQIEQVIVNLAINARDAMPQGGTLTLETRNAVLEAEYCREQPGLLPGDYVMLGVTDTGIGMDASTRARIFEPFFTTKELGLGTGLGLAMVHGVIKQSGGHVWCYSELGRGTIFRLYLPRTKDPLEPEPEEATAPPESPVGTERILVIEDEDPLRRMTVRILASRGYTVLEAREGEEALAILSANPDIPLVLTDVIMPGLSGRALGERLRRIAPGIRMIYMSGYTGDMMIEEGVIDEGTHFIQKPFLPTDLVRLVRGVLSSHA